MRKKFFNACKDEIKANESKGDWNNWNPSAKEMSRELSWHMSKLQHAILSNDIALTKEYSADVAVFCDKAHEMAGKGILRYKSESKGPAKCHKCRGRGIFVCEDEYSTWLDSYCDCDKGDYMRRLSNLEMWDEYNS